MRWRASACFADVVWHMQKELERSMFAHTQVACYGSNSPLMPDLLGYEAIAPIRNTHTTPPQPPDLPEPYPRLKTAHLPSPQHPQSNPLTNYPGSTATTGAPPNPASTPPSRNTAPQSAFPPPSPPKTPNKPYASTSCTSALNTQTPSHCSYATRGPPRS
jgi:hypothetical protein